MRIAPDNPRTEEMAEVFGAPIIMRSPLREGSLRQAAREAGRDVLLFEAGEGLRFDELSVRAGVAGILRVMRHMKMIPARGGAAGRVGRRRDGPRRGPRPRDGDG